jgi:hypothetical protein
MEILQVPALRYQVPRIGKDILTYKEVRGALDYVENMLRNIILR